LAVTLALRDFNGDGWIHSLEVVASRDRVRTARKYFNKFTLRLMHAIT